MGSSTRHSSGRKAASFSVRKGNSAQKFRHGKPDQPSEPSDSTPTPSASDSADDREGALLEHFSKAIAQAEVCVLALRSFEEEPLLGSIVMALESAVVALVEAHGEVDHYLQGVTP